MAGSGTAHLRDEDADLALRVEHLVVEFPVGRFGTVHAVSDVSFDLANGETLGIVGESGCGKSTTAKAIMRVPPPTSGRIALDGVDLATLGADQMRDVRSRLQMIFQDAISSLNPRRRIRDVVAEPLVIQWLESHRRSPVIRLWERYVPRMLRLWRHPLIRRVAVPLLVAFFVGLALWIAGSAFGTEQADGTRDGGIVQSAGSVVMVASLIGIAPIAALFVVTAAVWLVLTVLMPIVSLPRTFRIWRERKRFREGAEVQVRDVLEDVGIDSETAMDRRPHEFSGGQAQRISIARALILDPKVVICDEPVSALDVSVQAQVLNLLEELKEKYGLSLIFIAHDLAVVKNIADRVVVMYLGKVCEVGQPDELFARPRHPYTEILMSAIPVIDPAVDPRAARVITGEPPSPIFPPPGCRFCTRCPYATERCAQEEPQIREISPGQFVACHHPVGVPEDQVVDTPAAVG
ncbi:MAG TPA: oligopeptide/dipeptide ABC transporter ATP-binding protein [Acidimicrobiales bacterium]|jgi:oligopeptide/dipeptide ABC transporter ATP-binding protein